LKQKKIKNKYTNNYKSTTCVQLKDKNNTQNIKSSVSNYKSNIQKKTYKQIINRQESCLQTTCIYIRD